ncbi:flagellar filament capping protein FliD [Paenibacillus solisilvae]|uniref:Flagellar filament capping protein FliD n=1 Tax=Paenibacillus solisilvae TaxID=2486751 RepID=A0ABW0W6Z6_9BACL
MTLNAPSGGSATTLNVVANTDKIVDTIKSFISDYNSLLDTVNGKLNEERYRKYAPLTDEQRSAMKDDEIKLWEDKAKSGLLHNDSTLSQAVNNIRLASVTSVKIDGADVNLSALGIRTGEWTSLGKLAIVDEGKLRAAIESNPDQVVKFFTQQTTEADPKLKVLPTNPDNGLFNRLSNSIMAALDGMTEKAGTSKYSTDPNAAFAPTSLLGTQLRDIDIRMSDLSDRLTSIETNYYRKFTAMETAMNRYNSQSSSLFGASQ